MAYDTEDLKAKALSAITENDLCFTDDVIGFLPCAKQTFYDHGLDQSDELKDALEQNRVNAKRRARNKWAESENATLQIAHYRLISDEEDRRKLSQQYNQHSGDNENPVKMVLDKYGLETGETEETTE